MTFAIREDDHPHPDEEKPKYGRLDDIGVPVLLGLAVRSPRGIGFAYKGGLPAV